MVSRLSEHSKIWSYGSAPTSTFLNFNKSKTNQNQKQKQPKMSRIATIFAALFSLAAASDSRADYESKFYAWMAQHNVKPVTGEAFVHFLENFISNDKIIEAHNAGNSTFTLGHNQFSHMNIQEWQEFVGRGLVNKPIIEVNEIHEAPVDLSAVPTSVDWVVSGAVTGVKDQGQCGSCWSFSASGALEGAGYVTNKKLTSLSEQNFVDCDTTDAACNGGLMENAFAWAVKNKGVCSEADYPYTSGKTLKAGSCKTSCTKVSTAVPKSYTQVTKNSDSALMSAIAQQPVAIAIEADTTAFQLYKSGVFTASCGVRTDHGVLAVGYGTDSASKLDFYKVKNSWATTWGESGYIRLVRGISQRGGQCGILTDASYPKV